jgi:hypothetical protein
MVYDPDREVVVMFGGTRLASGAQRAIPPDIHQLVSQPAFPHAQVEVELGSRRPEGIEAIDLEVRAGASGDADGLGPARTLGGGIEVGLWDYPAGEWAPVMGNAGAPARVRTTLRTSVTDRPERFVDDRGRLAVSIRSAAPATEAREARLELDHFEGAVRLRAGTR